MPWLQRDAGRVEQVEDAASVDAARSMGIDYLQGYAIGRPQPLSLAA